MLRKPSFYLAIIGLIAAISLVSRLRKPEPKAAPLAEPAAAPFAETIGAQGLIEAVDENVRIAPSAAGLVTVVAVKAGDEVRQGDPLFTLDDRDAKAAVATQEAEILVLQSAVQQAGVALADKADMLERTTRLAANAVSSVDERKRADFAVRSAQAALDRSRAELQQARANLDRDRTLLDKLTMRAPRDGQVLQVNVRPGEYAMIDPGTPAMLLGRIDHLQLRADVDEDYASKVRPGCQAVAYVKGSRRDGVKLEFVRIEPYIVPKKSLTGKSDERVDTRVLQIIFRFERPGFPVYVGQQMDVFLDAAVPKEGGFSNPP